MKYKPSKFNFWHKTEDGQLLLYNSATGTKSLTCVKPEKSSSVLEILKKGCDEETEEIHTLFERGFLICEETSEDSLKKLRVMETVMENSLHLIILPTEQCNFRCKYCYETFQKGEMSKEIQEAIIKYVRKNIHKHTGLYVSWFGGEPLEALGVVEYLSQKFQSICKVAKKTYSASMTTNGYNLSLETYQKLYNLGVYNYQITIDGLKAEHDRQRVLENGQGTFDVIISNLKEIKNKTNNFNASFIIRTNFTKRIYDNIEKYLDFYDKTFNDDSRFEFYIHMASDWGGERVEEFSDQMLSKSQYRDIINAVKRYGVSINYNTHFSHLNYQGCVCYASRKNSIVIGTDGTLYKCTGDFEFEKNKVGILTEDGILQYNKNYTLWLGGVHKSNAKCNNCFYSACCLSNNCPAVRVRGLPNEVCSFEKEHLGIFLELFDKRAFSIL